MAIRDLLWACPLCGRQDGIHPSGREEACTDCGTRFRRGPRAVIEAVHADGRIEARPAAEWAGKLPAEPSPLERRQDGVTIWRRDRVELRSATGEQAVRHRGEYVGAAERFGEPQAGELSLTAESLSFRPDDGSAPRDWSLGDLTAVQPSSGTLQVKVRRTPLLSVRFPEGSTRLWEESLERAIREWYRREGRGEVAEFQPRICVR